MTSIGVLATSHNRCSTTIDAIASVLEAAKRAQVGITFYLVDAGSTDGTVDQVKAAFPQVVLEELGDNVFWGAGMSRAGVLAQRGDHDYHLWLNDDVVLNQDGVERILATSRENPRAVVVGQLVDDLQTPTYGGFRRGTGLRRMRFENVGVALDVQTCDSLNGNVVLVPKVVISAIGGVDSAFPHAFGDIDYGLRARGAGFAVVQPAGVVGRCSRNPEWRPNGGPWSRLRQVSSVKRLPFRAWWTFCRRHGGILAPVFFAKPYLRAMVGPRRSVSR
ncbi:hypothetical protein GCM10009623_13070 [Nocardioides aestuarii]